MSGNYLSNSKRTHLIYWAAGLLTLMAAAAISIVIYSEYRLAKLVPGGLGERFPTKVYSAPFIISDHVPIPPDRLFEKLGRLSYKSVKSGPVSDGQYHWASPLLTVGVRAIKTPLINQEATLVSLERTSNNTWKITSSTGAPIMEITLEPELIAELSGPQKVRREPAAWEDFPPALVNAVITVEDRRFYKHHGIDGRAILRAAWFNLRHRRNLQGGSTITQQLVKNFFLSQERTLQRKMLEAAFALYLDFRYSKERIMTLYLNQIYMGQDGVVSIAGMRAAANFYFGKDLRSLTLPESALLAGIIRSPFRYNPFQNTEASKARRDTVLKLMLDEGVITERDYETARTTPIATRKRGFTPPETGSENDYYVAEVIRQLVPVFSEDVLFRYGLKIYTSLDPQLQKIAQRVVRKEKKNQAALIAIEPSTGRVLALVGGKNFKESQFNRATQAHRQPGSAFKPFVYGAALENGFTPASILQDEPRAFRDGNKVWAPHNFDGLYRGPVSLRDALANSINGATLDLIQKIGAPTVIRFAEKMGIESSLENSLALALGTSEVTPFEITVAFAPFANGGFRVAPMLVTAVVDSEENTLELLSSDRRSVLDPALSYLMTSLMETTVTEGTAKSLKSLGWDAVSAGKTGTTNEGKDAWFIGYTPEILVGVWVGNDEAKAANLTGAKNAVPIWGEFMKQALGGTKPGTFEKPAGLISVTIDPLSGLLARSGCPNQKEELFVTGSEPRAYCGLHAGGVRGFLMRLFRKKPETLPSQKIETTDD